MSVDHVGQRLGFKVFGNVFAIIVLDVADRPSLTSRRGEFGVSDGDRIVSGAAVAEERINVDGVQHPHKLNAVVFGGVRNHKIDVGALFSQSLAQAITSNAETSRMVWRKFPAQH